MNALDYGEVLPLEKKKLQHYRETHGISTGMHACTRDTAPTATTSVCTTITVAATGSSALMCNTIILRTVIRSVAITAIATNTTVQ